MGELEGYLRGVGEIALPTGVIAPSPRLRAVVAPHQAQVAVQATVEGPPGSIPVELSPAAEGQSGTPPTVVATTRDAAAQVALGVVVPTTRDASAQEAPNVVNVATQ